MKLRKTHYIEWSENDWLLVGLDYDPQNTNVLALQKILTDNGYE